MIRDVCESNQFDFLAAAFDFHSASAAAERGSEGLEPAARVTLCPPNDKRRSGVPKEGKLRGKRRGKAKNFLGRQQFALHLRLFPVYRGARTTSGRRIWAVHD